MSDALVPLIDFADYRAGGKRRQDFVAALGRSLESTGFVKITGHGVRDDLLTQAYDVAQRTFGLPDEVKRQYEKPEISRQRGYTSFGVERAKDRAVADLKEFWHVGAELSADHPLSQSGDVPQNHYPREMPVFRETFHELFTELECFAKDLLVAIGAHLGVPEADFRGMVEDGNSVLRVIHYPDNPEAIPGAVRAARHEDINLLTVLPVSTRPGLQLLTRDGEWVAIDADPGVMVCDTGDMMQVLTNGRIPATTHRVVNPDESDGGRLSMPFFLHPHPDHVLTPLGPGGAEPISSREFLLQRLRDNGVG